MNYTAEQANELEKQLLICLENYEKGKPLISDDKYDTYKKILQQKLVILRRKISLKYLMF